MRTGRQSTDWVGGPRCTHPWKGSLEGLGYVLLLARIDIVFLIGPMDLVSFLQGLQPSVLNDCYSAPFTAAALFRALPPLGKQYVLRLLLVDDEIAGGRGAAPPWPQVAPPPPAPPPPTGTAHPVPHCAVAVVSSWANPSASGKHIATLDQLKRLALLSTRAGRLGEASYSLDPIFRGQLRHSMCTRWGGHHFFQTLGMRAWFLLSFSFCSVPHHQYSPCQAVAGRSEGAPGSPGRCALC